MARPPTVAGGGGEFEERPQGDNTVSAECDTTRYICEPGFSPPPGLFDDDFDFCWTQRRADGTCPEPPQPPEPGTKTIFEPFIANETKGGFKQGTLYWISLQPEDDLLHHLARPFIASEAVAGMEPGHRYYVYGGACGSNCECVKDCGDFDVPDDPGVPSPNDCSLVCCGGIPGYPLGVTLTIPDCALSGGFVGHPGGCEDPVTVPDPLGTCCMTYTNLYTGQVFNTCDPAAPEDDCLAQATSNGSFTAEAVWLPVQADCLSCP